MEPKRGLFAGGGTTVRLPRQLAFPAAMEFLLTAEAFPAPSGRSSSACSTRSSPEDELDGNGRGRGPARITANAPLAVQATKESVLRGLALDLKEAYKLESEIAATVFSSPRTPRRARRPSPRSARRTGRAGERVTAVDPRTPCIIGVAQHTVHPGRGRRPSRSSCGTTCAGPPPPTPARRPAGSSAAADSLQIVYCQAGRTTTRRAGWPTALGIDPAPPLLLRHRRHHAPGARPGRGRVDPGRRLDLAVITGAEALDTVRQAKKAGERLAWCHRDPEKKPFPFEAPFHPAEVAHEVFQAWLDVPRLRRGPAGPAGRRPPTPTARPARRAAGAR